MSNPAHNPGCVGEIKIITKDMPNQKEALELLQKLHSLCRPIQKAHGWYLPTLTEFFPKNPNLLGMNQNAGQIIFIRLRPAHDKGSFLPLEEMLVGTLLHEFSHNVRGPHDEIFYKTLDGLNKEYDELRAKGYSGEGFLSDGKKVGGSHNVPPHEARAKAIAEAERRAKLAKIMGPAGGRSLGGGRPPIGAHPRELALAAAERRAADAKSCGHGDAVSDKAVQEEAEQAEKDTTAVQIDNKDSSSGLDSGENAMNKMRAPSPAPSESSDSSIEIIEQPIPRLQPKPSTSSSTGPRPTPKAGTSSLGKRLAPPSPARIPPSKAQNVSARPESASRRTEQEKEWICSVCTFENTKPLALACEMCGTEKAGASRNSWELGDFMEDDLDGRPSHGTTKTRNDITETGWICHICSTETEHMFWTCRTCGTMKLSS